MGSIDDLDREIMRLITERIRTAARQVAPEEPYSPAALQNVRDLVGEVAPDEATAASLERIAAEIYSCTMTSAAPVSVAFLGPAGTFSHQAAMAIFGSAVSLAPQRTITDVFRVVEGGSVRYGVVPVENSTEGAVTYTLDELIETDLSILSEQYLRITFALLSRAASISDIQRVYTMSQPLGQCKGWLRVNLPGADIRVTDSTAQAAAQAAVDRGGAAIASELAARLYDLPLLAATIEDARQNFTRFYVVGRQVNRPTGSDKTSIVCALRDRPGALLDLLRPLSEAGINMTRIESRPDKKKMWEYNFFIDFLGHRDDAVVIAALDRMRDATIFLKILGSYPAGH